MRGFTSFLKLIVLCIFLTVILSSGLGFPQAEGSLGGRGGDLLFYSQIKDKKKAPSDN